MTPQPPPPAPAADPRIPLILVRTHRLHPPVRRVLDRLRAQTTCRIAVVADERHQVLDTAPFDKVSLTRPHLRALGLHCPRDAGWRCGDYGFYLARAQLPPANHTWMIEPDVAIRFDRLADFFDLFAAERADALLCQFRTADRSWFWYHGMRMHHRTVYRCLFPVLRLSARAIDRLLARRQAQRNRLALRCEWPNDESFVATEAMAAGLLCKDLNDCGRVLYDNAGFSFHDPIDGDTLDATPTDQRLYHPVLYGADLAAKRTKLAPPPPLRLLRERLTRKLMRLAWT